MTWLVLLIAVWVTGWGLKHRGQPRSRVPASQLALRYTFDARQNWALCIAHSIANTKKDGGLSAYADPSAALPTVEQGQALRNSLLHIFGLRSSLNDAQIRSTLNAQISRLWFRIDLDKLRPEDDPLAALAFACARVTFAVRAACLLGWLDEAAQWYVLLQNAQRANDCFDSWHQFGTAWARGRQQWTKASRADSLGLAFSEADVQRWLTDPQHPWHCIPWQVPPLFAPLIHATRRSDCSDAI